MIIYIDESGDLGWSFDKPFRNGGSSRYLTITSLLVPNSLSKYPKRIIKEFNIKYKIPVGVEIKGAELDIRQQEYFVNKANKLLHDYPSIKIINITVKKENVQEHIRADGNKLYNYMIGLALLDIICNEPHIDLLPDPRSIKVKSGNSLPDYLQIKIWFEKSSKTILSMHNINSQDCASLRFADFIAHIVWSKYENGKSDIYDKLSSSIIYKQLFF